MHLSLCLSQFFKGYLCWVLLINQLNSHLLSSHRATFSGSPLQRLTTSEGEVTQGPPATPCEATKRWHCSLKPSISSFFFLFFFILVIFLLLLLRVAPHQVQSALQGAPHAAHPTRYLQLGWWQFASQELHGWKVHTAGRPSAWVTMGTGSAEKLWKWYSLALLEIKRLCESEDWIRVLAFNSHFQQEGKEDSWCYTKQDIVHRSWQQAPSSLSIYLWLRSSIW